MSLLCISFMYTKQEISRQKQAFWTAFGKYMKPVLSADGEEISWINYKTGIKGISFKMEADSQKASISIVLSQSDTALQQAQFGQFQQLKSILAQQLQEDDWTWQAATTDEYGKPVSTISKQLHNVSIFRTEDWPPSSLSSSRGSSRSTSSGRS